jgi:hypothetical protein
MSFLAPLFFVGLAAVAVPIFVHLIQRERRNVIEFPSLMFVQRVPFQSVERRRIHNWPLLLLRLGAMALLIAAFARPFFNVDPVSAAAAATGAREVVILLDRSASLGYGDHWERAQREARRVVSGLGGGDRATLVLFDQSPEETIRATFDTGTLNGAIAAATVTAGSTRYAPALRLAQSLLSRSDRSRREAYLISDFQRSGWERQEEIVLPEGATLTPVPIGDGVEAGLSVASISVQRASFSGQERATIVAGLVNRSPTAVQQPVRLEIDGRVIETKTASIGANASGSVTFEAVTVADANLQGVIRAGTDAFAKDNDFYFVLSPSRPLGVLVVDAEGARGSSLYVKTVLDLGKTPPFRTEITSSGRLTDSQLDGKALVILNDASTLGSGVANRLRAFVERGGGLLIALGERTPVSGDWPVLPGSPGAAVDRMSFRGGTLGYLDYSHPVLDGFRDPGSGNFASMRFLKYRALTPGPADRVLARFDDGGAALVERRVGNGRVMAFTSTFSADWNDAPKHAMFLPLLHEIARYLAQYEEPEPWHTVGRMLDISAPVGALVRQGAISPGVGASGVVVAPSGQQSTLGQGGAMSIELAEQGFYSVRLAGTGDRRPFAVAVNLDPAESDLSALQAAEFLAAVTTRPAGAAGQALEQVQVTPVDVEKRQSVWWFLVVTALGILLVESVLANRMSGRPGYLQVKS